MDYDQQSLKNFANYCRGINCGTLKSIDQFEKEYFEKSAVWWYTSSAFVYPMLNAALRLMEAETIINMGFFIHDFHNQIQQLHRQQLDGYRGKVLTVYRGQELAIEDFQKLRKTKGRLMSFNNFLSTSTNRDISLIFAEMASTNVNKVGILFKISIDPTVSSASFASISEFSHFQEEGEILFSMHTVFRVGEITEVCCDSSLYQVNLQLTADDDKELRILTKHICEEVAGETGWQRLTALLVKIGHFNKAEELCNALLNRSVDSRKEAMYYNNLGHIKDQQGDHRKAIECYEKAIKIQQKVLPVSHPDLMASYINIGIVYDHIGEYSKALSFYEKELQIKQEILPVNHPSLATSSTNIGSVYVGMGEYSTALSFYERALEIERQILPANHPSLATSYSNIGLV